MSQMAQMKGDLVGWLADGGRNLSSAPICDICGWIFLASPSQGPRGDVYANALAWRRVANRQAGR